MRNRLNTSLDSNCFSLSGGSGDVLVKVTAVVVAAAVAVVERADVVDWHHCTASNGHLHPPRDVDPYRGVQAAKVEDSLGKLQKSKRAGDCVCDTFWES